jgi:hypothetical protein
LIADIDVVWGNNATSYLDPDVYGQVRLFCSVVWTSCKQASMESFEGVESRIARELSRWQKLPFVTLE